MFIEIAARGLNTEHIVDYRIDEGFYDAEHKLVQATAVRVFLTNGNERRFTGKQAEAFLATVPGYDAMKTMHNKYGSAYTTEYSRELFEENGSAA